MNLSQIFILIAVVLFVWAGFIFAGWVDFGNAGFIACMGGASFALGHLAFANRDL